MVEGEKDSCKMSSDIHTCVHEHMHVLTHIFNYIYMNLKIKKKNGVELLQDVSSNVISFDKNGRTAGEDREGND